MADGGMRSGRLGAAARASGSGACCRPTARVVLATAHLDHDPTNNDAANLTALFQHGHLLHDKAEHLRRRRLTYLARRAIGDLFTGPYYQ